MAVLHNVWHLCAAPAAEPVGLPGSMLLPRCAHRSSPAELQQTKTKNQLLLVLTLALYSRLVQSWCIVCSQITGPTRPLHFSSYLGHRQVLLAFPAGI
jgi:hypothetical protein